MTKRLVSWDSRAGVKQVRFVGAHADVGGGYTSQESRLSDIALEWTMKRLAEVGVRLQGAVRVAATLATAGHEHGHDSR